MPYGSVQLKYDVRLFRSFQNKHINLKALSVYPEELCFLLSIIEVNCYL
jgi:hypothetical protein